MKKIALFFVLIFSLKTTVHSQVKHYIPIVKPVLYEKTKETFEDIANKFEQRNQKGLAEIFRSFAQGGHGSGFIYVDTDGENYIITNRHVVANSETVDLEFSEKGGAKKVYTACPIIYTDDNIDLAIVKFPNQEKVFKKSFSLSSGMLADGAEIWSAGFPGLLGKPMWQFAKGNITNEEAYVDELVGSDVSYLIQHSASIDPGNSGGPILVKDEKGGDNYSIIGVNTWTITNRQNTFFAIPAKNIPPLIQKAKNLNLIKSQKDSIRAMLVKQARTFSQEIKSEKPNWSKTMNFISYAYVGNKGWDNFIKVIEEGDSETLKKLDAKFFEYSPIEAMRFSILYRIWKKIYENGKASIEFNGINALDNGQIDKAKVIKTNFIINGTPQEIEWAYEHGHWRINNFNLDKVNSKKSSAKDDDDEAYSYKKEYEGSPAFVGLDLFFTPFSQTFNPQLNKNFHLMGYGGSFNIIFKDKTAIYTRVNSLSLNNKMTNPPENLSAASVKYLHVNQGFAVYIGRASLRPYFLIGANYFQFKETGNTDNGSVTHKFERFGVHLGAGLKYKLNKNFGIFAEGSYHGATLVPVLADEFYSVDLSNFQTSIGISIDFKKK